MSNELEKLANKLNDDPSLKELREWTRMTKKMIPVVRRWAGPAKSDLDVELQKYLTLVEGLLKDADNPH